MALDEQLSDLSRQIGALKAQLSREEGQLETLRGQRELLIKTFKEQGVDPEQLDAVIIKKEGELSKLLKEVDTGLTKIGERRETVLENIRLETEAR